MPIRVYRVTVDGDCELFNDIDIAMGFIRGEIEADMTKTISLESEPMEATRYSAWADTRDGVGRTGR